MTLELRCFQCDKHIGCVSLTGITKGIKSKYVKTIFSNGILQQFLCDGCAESRIDIDEEKLDETD